MTDRRPSLLNALTLIAFAAEAGLAGAVAINGPTGDIPMHFNIAGEADRWGGRGELALMLGGLALLGLILTGGMGLAASRAGDMARRRGLRVAQLVSLIAFAGVASLVAEFSLGAVGDTSQPAVMMAGTGLLIAALGAFLGRVGPNPFIGVRTPWAYKSRLAWDRSNRLAGRLFLIIGAVALIGAPFIPQPLGTELMVGAILAAAVWAVIESWRVWRDDPDRQPF